MVPRNLISKLFMFFALQLNFYIYIIIFCNRTSQEDHLTKSRTQQIKANIYRFNITAYYFFLFRDVSLFLKVKVIDHPTESKMIEYKKFLYLCTNSHRKEIYTDNITQLANDPETLFILTRSKFFGIFYMNRTLKCHSKGAIRKQILETY